MNTITITAENGETYSSISNLFIDYYMTQANGEFVKIYLYMVRLLGAGHSISIRDIADHFQCTQKDICRAIRYWVDRDVLRLEYNQKNELTGITVLNLAPPSQEEESEENSGLELLHKPETSSKVYSISQSRKSTAAIADMPSAPMTAAVSDLSAATERASVTTPAVSATMPVASAPVVMSAGTTATASATAVPDKKSYTATQLQTLEKDKDMENILYQFEMYCGHTPTQSEFQTLLYIYDQLSFPADLLEYLIEYCASLEHTSHRYMEKVAIDWYTRKIQTAQQAKQETAAYHALNAAISKELGLSRVLTPTELRYINTWKNDYSFQQEVIIEACQRASASNKINFRYINGILTNWHESHVTCLADIQKLEQQHAEQPKTTSRQQTSHKVQNLSFNDFDQRDYDNQELENFFIQEVQKMSEQS